MVADVPGAAGGVGVLVVMHAFPRTALLTGLFSLAVAPLGAQPLLSATVTDATTADLASLELLGIRDMYFTPSGDLVVLDLDRVIVFHEAKTERYVWGQMGEGPGEFEAPLSVAATDSIIHVGERGRVSTYTTSGEYIRIHRLGGPTTFVADMGFAGDVPVVLTMEIMGQSEVRRLTDTVAVVTLANTIRPGVMFAPIPTMTVTDDGRVVVTAGLEYELIVADAASGRKIGEASRAVSARGVTTAFQDQLRRYLQDPASAPEGWSQWVGTRPVPAAMVSQMRFSETFPMISRMFPGPGNALWVQRGMGVGDDLAPPIDPPSGASTSFDLFDLKTYEYLGVVRLEGDFQPMAGTGTQLAGVTTGGLAPTLRVVHVTF